MAMGIWLPGGGGADLDAVTASAGDVLAGKVIVGPDGEPLTGTLALSGNASDGQVLSGQTYYNTDAKTKRTGTMPNKEAVNQSLAINGSYTIPEGYHNGNGKVTQSVKTKGAQTFTPGRSNQVIGANQWLSGAQTIMGDPNLVSGNIRDGVTIFGTRGNVQEYKSPSNISMAGNIIYSTGGSPSYSVTSEGYGQMTIYANGQWWGIARLNNNLPLNLTGWNYINAQLYSHMQYYVIISEVTLGISQNSNLTSLNFTASHKYTHDRNTQNTMSSNVKLNVSNLTGNYYLYLAFRITKTVSGTDKKPYVQVRGATLSTQ